LRDALAEAVISANLQPLLRRSFGEGGFSLFLGINREFNRDFFVFELARVLIRMAYWGFGMGAEINRELNPD
jgi:hypothetical protein